MNILSVENISKTFADKPLFTELSFGLEEGQKRALIARNGAGKSTLMKIIAGIEKPDTGIISSRSGLRIGYLDQQPNFNPSQTVLQAALGISNPMTNAIREYEICIAHPEDATSTYHDRLQRSISQMDETHAWSYEARMKQILGRLNLHDLEQLISTLSGGQLKRLALAHTLIEEPDLLLLDEPTNHLDTDMVEWLEDYLRRSTAALLMITHDRYFLDNICTEISELENGKMYSYSGNYSYFLEKKEEREINKESELEKDRNIYRTELEWMRKQPKARTTKSKSRIDSFTELDEKVKGVKKEKALRLDVKMNRIGGKVLEMKKVYKKYDDKVIMKGFDYTFKTGERIGIVGANGSGKSTFLNMLVGKEHPDSGKINAGDTVIFGYYSQQGIVLKEDKRIIEVVKDIADVIPLADGSKVTASQFLNIFQFPPSMQQSFVSKLSGGERRRLFLLTVLIKNPNFLILDEPTNDLDLITLNTLENFLIHFRGCLLIVSHDRYFLDKLVDHLLIFQGDGNVQDFNGNYLDWRLAKQLEELKAREERDKKKQVKQEEKNKPLIKKFTFKEKLELENIEKEIVALEHEKKELEGTLSEGSGTHEEIFKWSLRYKEVESLLEAKSMRWMELSEG
ncbi:ABC-F family ATP-binding cassette domain-containing protein [soil metagenome]